MPRRFFLAAYGTVLAGAMAIMATAGLAQTGDGRERPATISVTAEGETQQAPDMAVLTLTVLREGDTARAALDANNAAMAEVMAALQADGVAERDLQTTDFSIRPRYVHQNGETEPRRPTIAGYEVSNTLTVRVRALERLGAILDQAVSLGVNQGGGIALVNDDPEGALSKARLKAVENARRKAGELAAAAGVSLGRVASISETGDRPRPLPIGRVEMRAMAADAAVPIAGGENTYRVRVDMIFEIAD